MHTLGNDFLTNRRGVPSFSHQSAYRRAVKMMRSSAAKAFDLDEEPAAVHDAYGRNPFGQGCLLARRLVERGVPFVEVTLSSVDGTNGLGWDTHAQNFDTVEKLSGVLDAGWSTLMTDLRSRGLLDSTLDRLDGRVRPDAEDQRVGRPRPFPERLVDRPRRRRDSRRPDDRRHRGRRRSRSRTGPSWFPTCSRPSSRAWGSTRPSRTPSTTAGRSGSSTRRPTPSRNSSDDGRGGRSWSSPWPPRPRRTRRRPRPAAMAARHLIFLAENRPVFLRLRVTSQGRPFEASWIDSVRTLHASLDRNGDGTLTTKEADPKIVAALVRLATGAAALPNLGELDVHPKDGKVSIDELAEALRPILGPFRLQVGRQAIGRTDALFDQLDRDKDGELTRPELAAIAGSLRPLDLDDDEMISAYEIEPFNSPAFAAHGGGIVRAPSPLHRPSAGRRARRRVSRRFGRPGSCSRNMTRERATYRDRPDNKLSPAEFAIDPDAFAERRYERRRCARHGRAAKAPRAGADRPHARRHPLGRGFRPGDGLGWKPAGPCPREPRSGGSPTATSSSPSGRCGSTSTSKTETPRPRRPAASCSSDSRPPTRTRTATWKARNRPRSIAPQSPLAGLSEVIDRDGDGKVYLKELIEFVDRQQEAARLRLVVTTADQGRAIFGILDLDRDRRLGAREVMRTVDRVMSWDGDGDGRVSPDEIPYHFQVTIARSGLAGLTGEGDGRSGASVDGSHRSRAGTAAGPDWFQKMDRNHDGDVSRREFLGPRDQFDRLDRDNDGLIDADEARSDRGEHLAAPARRCRQPGRSLTWRSDS